jgi:hypothetical protein
MSGRDKDKRGFRDLLIYLSLLFCLSILLLIEICYFVPQLGEKMINSGVYIRTASIVLFIVGWFSYWLFDKLGDLAIKLLEVIKK